MFSTRVAGRNECRPYGHHFSITFKVSSNPNAHHTGAWRQGDARQTLVSPCSFNYASGYVFLTTQVAIARMFCTTTVLSGSSNSPPRELVMASSISSSTRKRSLPSGRW